MPCVSQNERKCITTPKVKWEKTKTLSNIVPLGIRDINPTRVKNLMTDYII